METVTLNNGVKMPIVGYGVYQVAPEEAKRCVSDALQMGYRLIDTAQGYRNEVGVGEAIRESGIPREEIFLVDKIWIFKNSYEKARNSIDDSLIKLHTDYIDLMLIHEPFLDYYGAWRALEEAYRAGKVRAIGVSNFRPSRFIDLASNVDVVPAVNQVETHVFDQERKPQEYMEKYGTHIMAWAPLAEGRNGIFNNPVLQAAAKAHGKSVAQIALHYLVQRGVIVIPKSTHKERMRENLDILDFTLTDVEMKQIETLDIGHHLIMDHDDPEIVELFMSWKNLIV